MTGSDDNMQRTVGRRFVDMNSNFGFMYLSNSGVSERAIEKIFSASKQFFALPLDVKMDYKYRGTGSNCGYIGPEKECLDPTAAPDLKEAFNVRKPNVIHDVPWPSEAPLFQPAVEEFWEEIMSLAHNVMRAFAMGLNVPDDFFFHFHEKQVCHAPQPHAIFLTFV